MRRGKSILHHFNGTGGFSSRPLGYIRGSILEGLLSVFNSQITRVIRTKNGKTAPYYNVSILKYSLCVFCCFFHFFRFPSGSKLFVFYLLVLFWIYHGKKSTSRDLVAYLGERYYHSFDKHTQKLPLNSSYEKKWY